MAQQRARHSSEVMRIFCLERNAPIHWCAHTQQIETLMPNTKSIHTHGWHTDKYFSRAHIPKQMKERASENGRKKLPTFTHQHTTIGTRTLTTPCVGFGSVVLVGKAFANGESERSRKIDFAPFAIKFLNSI